MIIYRALCLVNGKSYVGQTVHSLRERRSQHVKDANRKSYLFHQALKKYGVDKFEWTVIDSATEQSELDFKEQYWIKTFGSMNPAGYNLHSGGRSHGFWSEEIKEKIRTAHRRRGTKPNEVALAKAAEWHRGRHLAPEHAAKLRAYNELRKLVPMSAEHRAKISAGNKGKKRSPECRLLFSRIQKNLAAEKPDMWKNFRASQFTDQEILTIRELADSGMCVAELACIFHAFRRTIKRIVLRKTFRGL